MLQPIDTDWDLSSIWGKSYAGRRMTQSWGDLLVWEWLLNRHHGDLATIIELGTWEGGMSTFLHAQAAARGLAFYTLDNTPPALTTPGFIHCDVFAAADWVRELIASSSPLVLLCDNGDKPAEMQEFAGALSPGDLLVVHDWMSEAGPEDVPACLEDAGYGGILEKIGSKSMIFRRGPRDRDPDGPTYLPADEQ